MCDWPQETTHRKKEAADGLRVCTGPQTSRHNRGRCHRAWLRTRRNQAATVLGLHPRSSRVAQPLLWHHVALGPDRFRPLGPAVPANLSSGKLGHGHRTRRRAHGFDCICASWAARATVVGVATPVAWTSGRVARNGPAARLRT